MGLMGLEDGRDVSRDCPCTTRVVVEWIHYTTARHSSTVWYPCVMEDKNLTFVFEITSSHQVHTMCRGLRLWVSVSPETWDPYLFFSSRSPFLEYIFEPPCLTFSLLFSSVSPSSSGPTHVMRKLNPLTHQVDRTDDPLLSYTLKKLLFIMNR